MMILDMHQLKHLFSQTIENDKGLYLIKLHKSQEEFVIMIDDKVPYVGQQPMFAYCAS